jgi:hypothetical protein
VGGKVTLLDAALWYVSHGFAIFPCRPRGKEPACEHGFKDATTDAARIREWWEGQPTANIGLPTGAVTCTLVLDSVFQHPGGLRCRTLAPGLDLKADDGYIVAAPSIHPSGNLYTWDGLKGVNSLLTLAEAPGWLLKLARNGSASPPRVEGRIPRGRRNSTLTSLAGSMRKRGMSETAIVAALAEENRTRCDPPLSDAEIRGIAGSVGRYNPQERLPQPNEKLASVVQTFERWLHLPDPGALLAVLGAVAGNYAEGDPIWLLLVGPPACGKTEILQSCSKLPRMFPTGVLTEAALLSGTASRDRGKAARGGLLRQIGASGTILLKDFGSVLSMAREARTPMLAALREIYDGEWTRRLGVEGGRTLTWRGKVALIGGCTPVIDSHHGVLTIMGERFLFYRVEGSDAPTQASRALAHGGREGEMRGELAEAVNELFDRLTVPPMQAALDEAARSRIIHLAVFAARCRSAVERDGYSREITLVPGAEAPARLALCLGRLLAGLAGLGVDEATLWRVLSKVALDCMPALRRRIIHYFDQHPGAADTSAVSVAVRYPTGTTRRGLEDLAAYGVVERESRGSGNADYWQLSTWAVNELQAIGGTFPEMSV